MWVLGFLLGFQTLRAPNKIGLPLTMVPGHAAKVGAATVKERFVNHSEKTARSHSRL